MDAKPLAILANGPSVLAHDLSLITCTVMTMNRSWELRWPDIHVALEYDHYARHPGVYEKLAAEGKLYVPGESNRGAKTHWTTGHRFRMLPESEWWSNNVGVGVVCEIGGVGSVAFAALQIAAWLGYTDLCLLGLDLQGGHFHGEWATSARLGEQDRLMKIAQLALEKRGVRVWNVGSPESLCTAFPHVTFGESPCVRSATVNSEGAVAANGNAEPALTS